MRKVKIFLFISMCILLIGCNSKVDDTSNIENNPIVTMKIKDYGTIKIELYPNIAYNTVANFVTLVESGYYDNNTIHRVQKDFVIQGGDKTGTGTGALDYTIDGEFSANGFENDLSHTEGVISMARTSNYNSAGSQFFIVLNDNAKYSLDGLYAGFGKVIEGMDIIHKIEEQDFKFTNEDMGMLKKPLTIESATVDTFNHKYTVKKNN